MRSKSLSDLEFWTTALNQPFVVMTILDWHILSMRIRAVHKVISTQTIIVSVAVISRDVYHTARRNKRIKVKTLKRNTQIVLLVLYVCQVFG